MPRRAMGYLIVVDPDPIRGLPSTMECDITECSHCNRVVVVDPQKDTCWCSCCDSLICDACERLGVCDHIEKKLARWEARDRLLRSMRG